MRDASPQNLELDIPDCSKMDISPFLNVIAQSLSRVSCADS
jgi:hypothetical protein